ncbi:hypothetical protein CDD83_6725 [Cordyceps sp. RAO-2017]|nr:hypothetical protein CDD83_6725 [Cordyceps sp. RAO-2017]
MLSTPAFANLKTRYEAGAATNLLQAAALSPEQLHEPHESLKADSSRTAAVPPLNAACIDRLRYHAVSPRTRRRSQGKDTKTSRAGSSPRRRPRPGANARGGPSPRPGGGRRDTPRQTQPFHRSRRAGLLGARLGPRTPSRTFLGGAVRANCPSHRCFWAGAPRVGDSCDVQPRGALRLDHAAVVADASR